MCIMILNIYCFLHNKINIFIKMFIFIELYINLERLTIVITEGAN